MRNTKTVAVLCNAVCSADAFPSLALPPSVHVFSLHNRPSKFNVTVGSNIRKSGNVYVAKQSSPIDVDW